MESRAKLLGHPIHPMLIVLPLGLFIAAVVFDLLFIWRGTPTFSPSIRAANAAEGTRSPASLRFWRGGDGTCHAEVLDRTGAFRMVKQPPPESLSAGLTDRFSALVDTLMP